MSAYDPVALRTRNARRVLYDGECGVCLLLAAQARKRDDRQRLELLPYQTQATADLPARVSKNDLECALHVVLEDGKVVRGAQAVFAVLEALPAPWSWAARMGSAPPALWLAEKLYPLFARHRSLWSRWMGMRSDPRD
ncbi:MAG TPA: DUF393 domain-containing protein [Anaerolineales bacterium]|nr:DUF393 domain-containing protein [Anaerolineales bacterium]